MINPPKPSSSKEPPRKSVRLQNQTVSEKKAKTSSPREEEEDEDKKNSVPVLTIRDLYRYTSATPEPPRVKLSRLISSSISQLTKVKDQLNLNLDYFPTERHQMAIVYSHTSGNTKGYLKPKYLLKTEGYQFKNAEEIIKLLRLYFVTSNK
ncbi:hypothetical protein GGP41_005965 [Bipolaris sorokiniana]|uniref:Uncharacterized protein n=1 Tax=Cochliobolus sativus TaxID=45130 RepID=A0A8H5ZIY0_COCSA|nr:hypothetical protein GGP41_005965 [Bipolaris sorokiniana]